ncbi:UDP-glucose 4-epimerase GalE [Bacillus sp. RO1]|uniref:UDP-glucose 4-epimerase GalE n=1 Tax=Bacillus sp. RO1 TaxID=2722703 RepID=UPI001456FF37|nr:UDP-glucose 4-epimerase GalE [Bacillus sp. RO1]NLP51885.1 UDP-glucose 4-epimerase GalE [Bacillus sp. RO1]
MPILVTGGAGYIGSHVCVELLNAGHEIIVVDNLANSRKETLDRVRELTGKHFSFYMVDILNMRDMERVFNSHNIEAIIHLAGLKAVGESVQPPLLYYQNNVAGTINLCKLMEYYGVNNLVFSSSATVYGMPEQLPLTELSPLNATNPYGRTKLIIEEMLRDFSYSNKNLSISLLRYFNPIGAHESGRIGEDPQGIPNNLLPYISQVAIGKLPELHVFGGDYNTSDGTGVRDYIHVVDLALGHVKALEYGSVSSGLEAFNLGTGNGYSVLEIVRVFEKVSGKPIPYRIIARRDGDVAVCYADASKARKVLGWQAERNLEEMCLDAWKWQINNGVAVESLTGQITKI